MNQELLRKVQITQLEIAKEIKRICEVNQVQYFMDGGTMLGAVRHKGFIPWDDDMDFGMLREQYDRFVEAAQEQLGKDYMLQTWNTDPHYGMPFAKVCKKGTLFVEQATEKNEANHGIYVDIFPYDNYPGSSKEQKQLYIHLTFWKMLIKVKKGYIPWHDREKVNRKRWFIYLPIRLLACFFSGDQMIRKYQSWALKYNSSETESIYAQVSEKSCGWRMKRSYVTKTVSLSFEDTVFQGPVEYDAYLTDGYGDYMTPPPPEKRENIHGVIKIEV